MELAFPGFAAIEYPGGEVLHAEFRLVLAGTQARCVIVRDGREIDVAAHDPAVARWLTEVLMVFGGAPTAHAPFELVPG